MSFWPKLEDPDDKGFIAACPDAEGPHVIWASPAECPGPAECPKLEDPDAEGSFAWYGATLFFVYLRNYVHRCTSPQLRGATCKGQINWSRTEIV